MSRWKVGIAALHANLISADEGGHLLLPGIALPESAQLRTFRAPPRTSRQSLGISNTSDNIFFEKPSSIASRIYFFLPEETIPVLCMFYTRTTTFSFAQSKLTTSKLSFYKKVHGSFDEPFLTLSQGLGALNPHVKNSCLPRRKYTKSKQCLLHKQKPQLSEKNCVPTVPLHFPVEILKFQSIIRHTSMPCRCSMPYLSSAHYGTHTFTLWGQELSLRPINLGFV